MGNRNTKSSLRNAIIYLNISADEICGSDEKFWAQIFSEESAVAEDIIRNISVQEIRMLRDGAPKNFAILAYKLVERLCLSTGTLCNTQSQQTAVLNAVRILTRMLPCIFEDPPWRNFLMDNELRSCSDSGGQGVPSLRYPHKKLDERNYAAYLPSVQGSRSATPASVHRDQNPVGKSETIFSSQVGNLLQDDDVCTMDALEAHYDNNIARNQVKSNNTETTDKSLMRALILSICDLLFCPEFTVLPHGDSYLANAVDEPPEDLKSLSTYDYVWEPGVGFDSNVNSTTYYDKNRAALLRAILVCLSTTLYEAPDGSIETRNEGIEMFVTRANRHALPLFTSLVNIVFGYKSPRNLLQLKNLLFESGRERLVELSCQLLMAALDYNPKDCSEDANEPSNRNLFIEYMSRIHRDEDFVFLIRGFIRLMNNGLEQGYIWTPTRNIEVDQELQVLLWKICNLNKKFLKYLLASNELLDIVIPILYHLNENFQETSKTALIHIGVFNLLVLSGERNFGVRLNKPYTANLLTNLPEFHGTHADLMIVVFHKLIMYGYKISQLYDYLLTVLVNVSPYLKGTTILACKCMMQLFETFSSVLVVFTEPNYHQLVISLLEIFNNLIQYQFDGNTNLVYIILSKKETFINLANLSTSQKSIDRVLRKLYKRKQCMERSGMVGSSTAPPTGSEHNGNDQGNENNNAKDPCDAPDTSLAIVSCATNSMHSVGHENKRQEVSLVATPDLHLTTHLINPFDSDSDALATNTSPGNGTCSSPEPKFGLEDILVLEAGHNEADAPELSKNQARDDGLAGVPNAQQQRGRASSSELDLLCDQSGFIERQARDLDTRSASEGSQLEQSVHGEKWRPTSAWLRAWKQSLPLHTVLRMICALEPQVQQFKRSNARGVDEPEVIEFLQNGTLVGLLPVPHPIQIRRYRTNSRIRLWFRAYTWAIIYVRSPIWTGTDIRLINVL